MVSWLRIHIAAWKVNRKYDLEALNQFLITCLGMESNLQEIYGYMKPPTGLGSRRWNENWAPQSGKGDEMCYGFGLVLTPVQQWETPNHRRFPNFKWLLKNGVFGRSEVWDDHTMIRWSNCLKLLFRQGSLHFVLVNGRLCFVENW